MDALDKHKPIVLSGMEIRTARLAAARDNPAKVQQDSAVFSEEPQPNSENVPENWERQEREPSKRLEPEYAQHRLSAALLAVDLSRVLSSPITKSENDYRSLPHTIADEPPSPVVTTC